jgi:tetratricopeptide (TPR) repeat protein
VGATDNALVQGRAVVFGQLPQQPDMVTAAVSVFGAYAPFSAAIYYMRKDLSVSERLASKLLVDENSVDRPWHLALMCVIKSKQNIDLVAKDYCDDALERGGKYLPYVHNSRATMFWRMGPENYVDALNELNIAARQDPRYAYALFNRCYLRYLMKRHRLEDILNECRRAISLEPLNGSFYYSIADVYEAAGHLNLAIESVKKAMILEPDDSQLPELRATLLRLVRAQRR